MPSRSSLLALALVLFATLLGWTAFDAHQKAAKAYTLLYEPIAQGPRGEIVTRADVLKTLTNELLQAAKAANEQRPESK